MCEINVCSFWRKEKFKFDVNEVLLRILEEKHRNLKEFIDGIDLCVIVNNFNKDFLANKLKMDALAQVSAREFANDFFRKIKHSGHIWTTVDT
jgi:hypothetical protein